MAISSTPQLSKPQSPAWLLPGTVCIAVVGLMLLLPHSVGYGGARRSLASWLMGQWTRNDGEWLHGLFAPIVVALLAWVYRKRYLGTEIKPAPWMGAALMVFGGLCFYVGYRANFYFFGYVSVQVMFAGLAVWFLGRAYFRRLFFLWAFLVFTWPLIFLEDNIAFTLRMFMTQFSSWFLNVVGVDNIRQGTAILSSPDAAAGLAAGDRYSLDIANPCSGIRSLFALTMICSIYSYVTLKKPWQRFLLILASVPLAIFGNFIRILLLLVGTVTLGSEVAIGKHEGDTSTYHLIAGFAVFLVAIVGMMFLSRVLTKGLAAFRRSKTRVTVSGAAGGSPSGSSSSSSSTSSS